VYHTLLVLHLLAAVSLFVTIAIFSAFVLGAPRPAPMLAIANVMWAVGGLGTLVFGIWLAIHEKEYDILDGWIIAAILLWAIATELGRRAQAALTPAAAVRAGAGAGDVDVADRGNAASQAALWHWARTVVVVALLVVMIYKPGA
jgi:hypothetical protein